MSKIIISALAVLLIACTPAANKRSDPPEILYLPTEHPCHAPELVALDVALRCVGAYRQHRESLRYGFLRGVQQ